MFERNDSHSFKGFVAAGLVVAALCGLVVYAVMSKGASAPAPSEVSAEPVLPPPTIEEYETSAAEVMGPFMAQAVVVDPSSEALAIMADLVTKTKERALRLRVPAERRDVHLKMVLLLDVWERAATGDKAAGIKAAADTAELVKDHPWLAR